VDVYDFGVDWVIRPARADEIGGLPALEASGGVPFRELGMDLVAEFPPPHEDVFEAARRDGHLLVAADDRVRGFVLLEIVDNCLHVEQITVAPDFGRRGIGAALMRAAVDLARAEGFGRMTLTTYRDVPFNGPFYASLGWQPIPAAELTDGLRGIRDQERAAGLDEWPRQAMQLQL
jgi:GNAT superfamily N-acetyltransferase